MACPIFVVDTLDDCALSALAQSLEESASMALLRQCQPLQFGICKVLRGNSRVELQVGIQIPKTAWKGLVAPRHLHF